MDVTDQEPDVLKRLTGWEKEFRESVKKDQAVYKFKRK